MLSPFSNIYIALQERLLSKVPELKFISRDTGQLNNTRPGVLFPCVLIEFDNFKFSNTAEQVQFATGEVVITLCNQQYTQEYQHTPTEQKEQSLKGFELEWQIHHSLQGFKATEFSGSLIRDRVFTITSKSSLQLRKIIYSITFDDYSCKPGYELVNAHPEIGIRI